MFTTNQIVMWMAFFQSVGMMTFHSQRFPTEWESHKIPWSGIGKCPILGAIGHHLIVAIIDHIPNSWVMFNGDI